MKSLEIRNLTLIFWNEKRLMMIPCFQQFLTNHHNKRTSKRRRFKWVKITLTILLFLKKDLFWNQNRWCSPISECWFLQIKVKTEWKSMNSMSKMRLRLIKILRSCDKDSYMISNNLRFNKSLIIFQMMMKKS